MSIRYGEYEYEQTLDNIFYVLGENNNIRIIKDCNQASNLCLPEENLTDTNCINYTY